ncbi:MAG: response regulator [Bacteroidetes bacterium]|nr:response regulator [Bacteroidota bacterium]
MVEDNLEDAALVEKYLEDAGFKYELFHAGTLFEGFEILQKRPIELVLLDLNLPDSTGFKTVTTFLERTSHVPVVVITANNNEIIGNQSVKAGVQDYLVKGQFDSRTFGRVVRFSLQRFKVRYKLEETAKELELNKKRFLDAQKMARFGTWEMDLVSNEMTWADEVYRIFSFQPGSIKPTLSEYLNYVPLEEKNGVEGFFENAGKDGGLHQTEHRILVDGTNIRYVSIQAKLQVEELGQKIILIGSLQDITERKITERLIVEKVISSQSAIIQEEVLSDLGFQIRTPLSSIVNLLFLLGNTETSTQQETFVSDLKTSVNDLSIAVNNLLNFSVMVTDNVKVEEEDIHLPEFLKGAENAVKIKADAARITLQFLVDEKLPEKITGDPRKITQIIYNLIDYAIRQSESGSKISVNADCGDAKGAKINFRICVKNSQKKLSLAELKELKDAEKLLRANLDEKEAVAKKRLMGIAIAAKLVKSLGGELNIRSSEEHGTELAVSLPVKTARQAKFMAGEAPEVPLRILLVEDHFLNQIATKKVLTSWSEFVTVDIAENGLVGVGKFREFGYDLLLMDIQMPVMNGLDAARKIREFSEVPIIALTANSTKQEQEKCLEIGMNDYLAKPFKPQELYASILSVMNIVV